MSDASATGVETLLIGIDAACPSVVGRVGHRNAIPNLERVFEDGVRGPLTSQLPPWTPSAWPSLYTGVNPGKHGVFGFLSFDGYDWEVVTRSHVREHAVWEVLDRNGVSSVVVNVPVTYPPRSIDGAVVPGYVAPENPTCHPEGLLAELRDAIGEYRVYGEGMAADLSREERIAEYERLTRMRGDAFCYLADRYDPGFGFVQFQQTDTVFHDLGEDWDAVERVYRAVDEQVGRILDACDPETVLVASDHGIGEYDGCEFRVNDYLRETGYVETTRKGDAMPSWDSIARNRLARGEEGDPPEPGALELAFGAAAKAGVTSQRLKRVFDAVGLTDVVAEHVPTDAIRAATESVDFAASRAYARSRIECGVRINLEGREPDGTVAPTSYRRTRERLIDDLQAATAPDGTPVFECVVPCEAVFSGPYVEEGPDVVTVPAGFEHMLSASLLGDPVGPLSEPFNHKRDGLVAAAGAGVEPGAATNEAHLLDVAPTILATFGIPRARRMDGTVLPFVEPAGVESHPEFEDPEPAAVEDATVERRLADMGYLE